MRLMPAIPQAGFCRLLPDPSNERKSPFMRRCFERLESKGDSFVI